MTYGLGFRFRLQRPSQRWVTRANPERLSRQCTSAVTGAVHSTVVLPCTSRGRRRAGSSLRARRRTHARLPTGRCADGLLTSVAVDSTASRYHSRNPVAVILLMHLSYFMLQISVNHIVHWWLIAQDCSESDRSQYVGTAADRCRAPKRKHRSIPYRRKCERIDAADKQHALLKHEPLI